MDGPWKCFSQGGEPSAWDNLCESPLQSTGLSRNSRNTYFAVLGERVAWSPQTHYPFQSCILTFSTAQFWATYQREAWEEVAQRSFKIGGSKLLYIWFWNVFLDKHFIMKIPRCRQMLENSCYTVSLAHGFRYIISDLFLWKMHVGLSTAGGPSLS